MNPLGTKRVYLGSSNMIKALKKVNKYEENEDNYLFQVTNSTTLFDRKNSNFLNRILPQLVGRNTKFYLGFTTNSLHHDTHKALNGLAWHNPLRNKSKYNKEKWRVFVSNCLKLIDLIVKCFLEKGIDRKELENRIIFVPSLPRFIFECCEERKEHNSRKLKYSDCVKTCSKGIQEVKQTANAIHKVSIVTSFSIAHFMYYSIAKMGVDHFFERKFLLKFLARTFIRDFKKIPKNEKAQMIFFKKVLNEKDNYTHFKDIYMKLWGKYLNEIDESSIVKNGTNVLFEYHKKHSYKKEKVKNKKVEEKRKERRKNRKKNKSEIGTKN